MEGLKTTEQLTQEERIRLHYGVSEEKSKERRWALTDKEKRIMADIRKCLTELEDLCK